MKTLLALFTVGALATLLSWSPRAAAHPAYYDSNCSGCHGTVQTCNGCHAHGTHADSTKIGINVTGTTDKTTYAPGETVNVTINGGYRYGWIRTYLYDQNGVVLRKTTGTVAAGAFAPSGGPGFPVALSAPAPTAAGTYTWKVAWYGNASVSPGTMGAGFTADSGNPGHGQEIVSTNSFTVVAPPPATAPKMSVSPTSLSFGTITLGGSAQQTTVVSNTGDADLVINSIGLCSGTSAEFSYSPTATPLTVAPAGSITLSIDYTPLDTTSDSGCITIAGNDTTNPLVNVNVSGAGANPPSPSVLDIDIVKLAVKRRYDLSRASALGPIVPQLTVVNASTATGSADATLVGVQNAVEVYRQVVSVSPAPGASAVYAFPGFTPTVLAPIIWTLDVADADPDVDRMTANTKVVP